MNALTGLSARIRREQEDLCGAIAKELGVKAEIKPVSVEARVPEVKLGRVDITVANLAYTLSRAEQIQFSDPYYLAKEMLIVPADDAGKKKADYAGQRIASTKGRTSCCVMSKCSTVRERSCSLDSMIGETSKEKSSRHTSCA